MMCAAVRVNVRGAVAACAVRGDYLGREDAVKPKAANKWETWDHYMKGNNSVDGISLAAKWKRKMAGDWTRYSEITPGDFQHIQSNLENTDKKLAGRSFETMVKEAVLEVPLRRRRRRRPLCVTPRGLHPDCRRAPPGLATAADGGCGCDGGGGGGGMGGGGGGAGE